MIPWYSYQTVELVKVPDMSGGVMQKQELEQGFPRRS